MTLLAALDETGVVVEITEAGERIRGESWGRQGVLLNPQMARSLSGVLMRASGGRSVNRLAAEGVLAGGLDLFDREGLLVLASSDTERRRQRLVAAGRTHVG